jgi:hypothetical protein
MTSIGETNIEELLKSLKPKLNEGSYVFCSVNNLLKISLDEVLLLFKEDEGNTIIIKKELADSLQLKYSFISSWITLTIHSSLKAVGLTSAFSNALAKNGISCNVVATYYHDHVFVDIKDTEEAMITLKMLSEQNI